MTTLIFSRHILQRVAIVLDSLALGCLSGLEFLNPKFSMASALLDVTRSSSKVTISFTFPVAGCQSCHGSTPANTITTVVLDTTNRIVLALVVSRAPLGRKRVLCNLREHLNVIRCVAMWPVMYGDRRALCCSTIRANMLELC